LSLHDFLTFFRKKVRKKSCRTPRRPINGLTAKKYEQPSLFFVLSQLQKYYFLSSFFITGTTYFFTLSSPDGCPAAESHAQASPKMFVLYFCHGFVMLCLVVGLIMQHQQF
jgi:hypothetical protein